MTANVVNLSGGKDSTAVLLLAVEQGPDNLSAVFADTGHEHPATYEYVDYLERAVGVGVTRVRACFKARIAGKREFIVRKWAADGVPQAHIDRALEVLVTTGNPFLDMCLWKGRFPSPRRRICTDELKVIPLNTQCFMPLLKEHAKVVSWVGVRRDESKARANLSECEQGDLPGLWAYRPILDWRAQDCFDLHKRHGIKWNPLYENGMSRVGCMPCVMSGKDEFHAIASRYPEEIDRVARWEEIAAAAGKTGNGTFFDARRVRKSIDEPLHYTTHGVRAYEAWSRTLRGGGALDPVKANEDVSVCRSVYGLCE